MIGFFFHLVKTFNFAKIQQSIPSAKTKIYDAYLKNKLDFEKLDFSVESSRKRSPEKSIKKAVHKITQNLYFMKSIALKIDINSEESILREINFLEKFSRMTYFSDFFPEYHGFLKETGFLGQKTYHIIFTFYPYNLRDLIEEGSICNDFLRIKSFFYRLNTTLAIFQSCDIVHRDIKPENILIDESKSKLFLADLGIAMKYKEALVKPVVYEGTCAYKSPEWFDLYMRKEKKGAVNLIKSDRFALGLVTLEMAGIKNRLMDQETYSDYMEELGNMIYEFEVKFGEENTEFIEEVKKCLEKDPEKRRDFLEIWVENLQFQDAERMKSHIFIQESQYKDLKGKSKKGLIPIFFFNAFV